MFETTQSLYEYEKRNWEGIEDLSSRHESLQSYDTEEYYYEGVITPISWDKNDNPTEYSLYMKEGLEMHLSPQEKKRCLAEFTNKTVLVKGVVSRSDFFGDYLLHYSKVSLLKDNLSMRLREVA